MNLEFHDSEVGNSLAGIQRNLDYDFQAEQMVQDTLTGNNSASGRGIIKFILTDDLGERAVWEIQPDKRVALTKKAERFLGEWMIGSAFPSVQ